MDYQFINFFLKQTGILLTKLAIIVSTTTVAVPVAALPSLVNIQGLQSDIHMIYRQDMLGTGEVSDINPLLVITPIDPRGVVVPTNTDVSFRPDPIIIPISAVFKSCPEYPMGGAPMNIKCGN